MRSPLQPFVIPSPPVSPEVPALASAVATRVMVVDDHPIVRDALSALINAQADMEVCAEAGDPAMTISLLGRARPDIVVLDYSIPGRSGTELIKDIIFFEPSIRILVFSMHDEEHYAERVLRAGASGFIMKSAGAAGIITAIRQILIQGVAVSSGISSRILRNLSRPEPRSHRSPVSQLSDREFEIFLLLGQGNEAGPIALELRISRKTVDVHRANIRRKLGLPNASALIHYASQWVQDERGRPVDS